MYSSKSVKISSMIVSLGIKYFVRDLLCELCCDVYYCAWPEKRWHHGSNKCEWRWITLAYRPFILLKFMQKCIYFLTFSKNLSYRLRLFCPYRSFNTLSIVIDDIKHFVMHRIHSINQQHSLASFTTNLMKMSSLIHCFWTVLYIIYSS